MTMSLSCLHGFWFIEQLKSLFTAASLHNIGHSWRARRTRPEPDEQTNNGPSSSLEPPERVCMWLVYQVLEFFHLYFLFAVSVEYCSRCGENKVVEKASGCLSECFNASQHDSSLFAHKFSSFSFDRAFARTGLGLGRVSSPLWWD